MKNVLVKGVVVGALIVGLNVLLDSFSTPLNNNMAMLQLEDSDSALATYDAFSKYGWTIKYGLSGLIGWIAFRKDIKKLFSKKD